MSEIELLLKRQQRAMLRDGMPSLAVRRDRLQRVQTLVFENRSLLCDVMQADFGSRAAQQSMMTDIYSSLASLKFCEENLAAWMQPQKRRVMFPFNVSGARAEVRYQPKGVVGIIATWNFPLWTALSPLASVLAAGNRCIIKLSEYTPQTSGAVEKLVQQYFSGEELAALRGDATVSAQFAALPWDHLLFTGSSTTGKQVMAAAALHLTPVTLELGGKSPVIVGKQAPLRTVAEKIVLGKSLNAGQVCLAPDYILVRDHSLNELIAELERAWQRYYPDWKDNPDYGAIINERHARRLQHYLDDVRQHGGEIWPVYRGQGEMVATAGGYKLPPVLVIEPADNLLVMQEEIFGPILPIKSYRHIDDAIEYIQDHPRPLALYYFGKDKTEQGRVLSKTISGGVTINDVIQHVACEDLPFGGIGPSGMGRYHGQDGFRQFSHQRAVYSQGRVNWQALSGLLPPYSHKTTVVLEKMLARFRP